MSPTHTSWSSSGARASTSWGSLPQPVTPTVSPVAGSTVKILPVSPESLVVTTSPPAATRPLDWTMSFSWKEKTTWARSEGATAAPSRNGTATSPVRTRSSIGLVEQLGQPRADAPGSDQVVVVAAERAARDGRSGAGGAEQGVAWGVL